MHCQPGKVKQMVVDIENKLRENNDNNCKKTNNSAKAHRKNIDISTVIEYLLELQMRLRNDLTEIEWPPLNDNNYRYMISRYADKNTRPRIPM